MRCTDRSPQESQAGCLCACTFRAAPLKSCRSCTGILSVRLGAKPWCLFFQHHVKGILREMLLFSHPVAAGAGCSSHIGRRRKGLISVSGA